MGGVVSRSRACLFCAVAIAGYEKEIRSAHLPVCRMIGIAFIAIAVLTLAAGLAAALMPRLIHAALSLVLAFAGLAAFFFLLGAEFVGLVQIFVYVGAVAVLIVFTILLTRYDVGKVHSFNWSGVVVAVGGFFGLGLGGGEKKNFFFAAAPLRPTPLPP